MCELIDKIIDKLINILDNGQKGIWQVFNDETS